MDATRSQKIEFINKYLKRGGKKITKKELNTLSDDTLDIICAKFPNKFEQFLNTPTPKLQKFYAECVINGKELTYEMKATDEQACIDKLESDGAKIERVVPAKGHHICKYCGSIADGTYGDLLCDECKDTFGHSLYSEL